MLKLYTQGTPNCQKIAIFFQETGLDYEEQEIKLQDGEQKEPSYLAICPNGRIPALYDSDIDRTSGNPPPS